MYNFAGKERSLVVLGTRLLVATTGCRLFNHEDTKSNFVKNVFTLHRTDGYSLARKSALSAM